MDMRDFEILNLEIDFDVIDKTQVVHFGTLSMTDEPSRTATRTVVEYAKKKGKLITFDPNLRRPLWSDLSKAKEAMLWGLSVCDIIKISSDEVEFLFGTDVENGAKIMLSDYNPKLVFITMGEKGCYFMNENSCGYVDGLSGLRVVDTVGAGDIFGASALFKVLEYNVPIDELTEKELYEISKNASNSEKIAQEIENEALAMSMAEYMENHIGETYSGIITEVYSHGMFIKTDNMISGKIKFEDMLDDKYHYDSSKKAIIGKNNKKKYQIGNRVFVVVKDASKPNRTINFEIGKQKSLRK